MLNGAYEGGLRWGINLLAENYRLAKKFFIIKLFFLKCLRLVEDRVKEVRLRGFAIRIVFL